MNDNEIRKLFDYIESRSHKDGVITREDILESIGPDLNNDGKVTNDLLYRKKTNVTSKYTGRETSCYEYSIDPNMNGFTPYLVLIDNVEKHVSERDLILNYENNLWLANFKDELKDDEITFEEFKKVINTPW